MPAKMVVAEKGTYRITVTVTVRVTVKVTIRSR